MIKSRTIKFRAWDNNKKQMRHWSAVHGSMLCNVLMDWKNGFIELMQYTGLLDKNSKEIYEGDIVKFGKYAVYEIVYEAPKFRFKFNDYIMDDKKMWNRIEIIGNIYENKELLL